MPKKKGYSPKHGVKLGKGEPKKGTDGYYVLEAGSAKTNAEPWGGCGKKPIKPAGPIRDGRRKIKIP
jgi:hypothetical protein